MSERTVTVDIAGLARSSQMLHAIAEDLGMSHHRIEGLRSRSLGSRTIDNALNDFADHWNYGWNQMKTKLEETSSLLRSTVDGYRSTEAAIAHGFEGPQA